MSDTPILADFNRRGFLRKAAAVGALVPMVGRSAVAQTASGHTGHGRHDQAGNRVVGEVNHAANGFDPHKLIWDFDVGTVSTMADGRVLREWIITAVDHEFEVAPGVKFAGWSYNGRIPGPTLRCTEGERLRIRFINGSTHPHSMHFHGIHSARMDGVPGAGMVEPGAEFTYEFDAKPFGCHLYHCHAIPLKRHIHKGLYGVFIVDPDPARHPESSLQAQSRLMGSPENAKWQEMVMVMNAFDTNFDDENEFYCVNSIPFAYFDKPIRVERSRPIRIYLDSGWPRDNYEVTRAMRDTLEHAGWRAGTDLHYFAFPRATHDEAQWASRVHLPLQVLFGPRRDLAQSKSA